VIQFDNISGKRASFGFFSSEFRANPNQREATKMPKVEKLAEFEHCKIPWYGKSFFSLFVFSFASLRNLQVISYLFIVSPHYTPPRSEFADSWSPQNQHHVHIDFYHRWTTTSLQRMSISLMVKRQ
jgi:hypothetical protein